MMKTPLKNKSIALSLVSIKKEFKQKNKKRHSVVNSKIDKSLVDNEEEITVSPGIRRKEPKVEVNSKIKKRLVDKEKTSISLKQKKRKQKIHYSPIVLNSKSQKSLVNDEDSVRIHSDSKQKETNEKSRKGNLILNSKPKKSLAKQNQLGVLSGVQLNRKVKQNIQNNTVLNNISKIKKNLSNAEHATSELKQKGAKRKITSLIEDSNTVSITETKQKRRKRDKSVTKVIGSEKILNSLDSDITISKLPQFDDLDFKKVHKVVEGLFSVFEQKQKERSNDLFGNEAQNISLQVNSIKKPICPTRLLRFMLPYSLYNELSEICLFVPDKKGVKKDIDKTVEYYLEKLEENKITNISKILPLRALSTEYTQHEMRRKLANQFDAFLADGRISHLITKRLGRMFAYSTKTPVPMHLEGKKEWKLIFQNALSKTQMAIGSNSDSTSVIVGTTSHSPDEVTKNIEAVCKSLAKVFPGGWLNIRSLFIRTKNVPSIPVYMSIISPNLIKRPVIKSLKRPKNEEFEGELSTMLDATVTVKSDGTVIVHKPKRKQVTEESDLVDEEIIKEALKHRKQSKTVRDYEGEVNDDEKIINETERKFLKKLAADGKDSDPDSDVEEKEEDNDVLKQFDEISQGSQRKNMMESKLKKKSSKHLEKKAKTNWIKSTKKGAKKLSKDQRKALIKVKKAEKKKK